MAHQNTAVTPAGSPGAVTSSTPPKPAVYSFEGVNPTQRQREKAENVLPKLANRLRLNNADSLGQPDKDLLFNYIIQHHLNIEWYIKGKNREKGLRKKFFIGSLTLLFLIPIALFLIPNFLGGTENAIAGITAVLTGLLGIYRTFSEWFGKRKLVGLFWKASADLKENLYTFEDTWKYQAKQDNQFNLTDTFRAALKEETKNARAIVRAEKEQFYNNISPPTIDLQGELKKSQAQAKELMDLFIAPTAKRALVREQTERSIRGMETRMAELDRMIFEKLERFTDSTLSQSQKDSLEAVINDMEKQRAAAEGEHLKLKEKLAAA